MSVVQPAGPRPADTRAVFGAIDIGASGGRVAAGIVADGVISIDVVHRFANGAVERDGHLRWDIRGIYAEVITGLTVLAHRYPEVRSLGVDTWAVDYGRLDAAGELLADPIAYRDDRTADAVGEVHQRVPAAELYRINGLQVLAFNTIYQLSVDRRADDWAQVANVLLLPDLIGYWLTGRMVTETTNASTTGLFDAGRREWSVELIDRLGLTPELLAPLTEPGQTVGPISVEVAERTGLRRDVAVVAVGSHDTASAVVGVPATTPDFAYISCGTWSLVGLELDQPVLTEQARAANFTNEGGVDRRIRFLRNVGGLWLLQESMRCWREHDQPADLAELLAAAAELPSGGPLIDVDDERFLAPGDMPGRIARACRATGTSLADGQVAVVRCILESLAHGYADTLAEAEQLTGRVIDVVHLVGGGAQNDLLCQLTADATRRTVLAGPTEATGIGNICVQASVVGALPDRLEDIRAVIANGMELRRFEPVTRQFEPVTQNDPVTQNVGARP